MGLRTLTVLIPEGADEIMDELSENPSVVDLWQSAKARGKRRELHILSAAEDLQDLVDLLQRRFHNEKDWRLVITPVETTIPRHDPKEQEQTEPKKTYGRVTREALFDQILRGTDPSKDFITLVILSTIVTAIGLVTNNLAVIIGAMVIAPLLGPILALSFGITLGDKLMIHESLKANAIGFGLTLGLSILAGLALPYHIYAEGYEYLSRTTVGYDGILLALASGAAAVLSLTAGISSAMVGVMVAVALMPPAVALGLSLGAGAFGAAYGAGLLLAINVICVNLSAKIVLTFKGIRPRTWYRRKKSEQSVRLSMMLWAGLLILLVILIFLWKS